jgi:hypothetical protein
MSAAKAPSNNGRGGRTPSAQGTNPLALKNNEVIAKYNSEMSKKGRESSLGWVCCKCMCCFTDEVRDPKTNCGVAHKTASNLGCAACLDVRVFDDRALFTSDHSYIPHVTGKTGWFHNTSGCRRHYLHMNSTKNCVCGEPVGIHFRYTCEYRRH